MDIHIAGKDKNKLEMVVRGLREEGYKAFADYNAFIIRTNAPSSLVNVLLKTGQGEKMKKVKEFRLADKSKLKMGDIVICNGTKDIPPNMMGIVDTDYVDNTGNKVKIVRNVIDPDFFVPLSKTDKVIWVGDLKSLKKIVDFHMKYIEKYLKEQSGDKGREGL
jgi:hypothetical protein